MQRRALIVGGAAGPEEVVREVLPRFGFGPAIEVENLGEVIALMRGEHFDLAIVPVHHADPLQLTSLEREIRRGRSTHVIGTAPKAEPDLILRAMRSGIHEFLVHPPEAKDLAAAVDRLIRRTHSEGQRGQVVAVYSAKGGTGTTTVAVNAAHCIAANHPDSRVALADLVVSGGDVRLHLDLRPTYDLSSLAEKLDRLDAELLYSLLTNSSGGLWALPAPDNPEFEDTLDASTLGTIVEHLRMHFAFTVLDCEHHLTERTLAALDAADRILLVTQLSVPALRSTQRSIELCRRLGYPEEKLCVVVNRFQSGEVLSLRDAADVLKCEIFWKIPNDYRTSAGALMKGLPVSEFAADSKLAWSFAQLASKLGGNSAHPSGGNGVAHKGSRLARLFRSNRES